MCAEGFGEQGISQQESMSVREDSMRSMAEQRGSSLIDLMQSVCEFHDMWFPDASSPDAVQSFWFAARYARERKFFRKLCRRFGPALSQVLELANSVPECFHEDLDIAAQMKLCIFMDQQSRNMRALEEDAPAGSTESMIEQCTRLCLLLATRVLEAAPSATSLVELAEASAAQVCFFTLALRHSLQIEHVRAAGQLLSDLAVLRPDAEVVSAFRRENDAALRRLEDAAYVEEALREATPELWAAAGEPAGPCPSNCDSCLAPRCSMSLDWVDDSETWAKLSADPLCLEIASALREYGLAGPDAHVVLSYSGGVDSTAHLLLLLAAIRSVSTASPPEAGRVPGDGCAAALRCRFSCLMLSYPNRDEAEVHGERQWAAWVCRRLGVNLYGYVVRLVRPHADEPRQQEGECSFSREDYERHTKEIRFRMYRCLLEGGKAGPAAVILGHHLDDVDENRLDHLQKGHLLGDVEGMRIWREILGVSLLRPLLRRRKADFQSLLAGFPVPYFRDSTPDWSVRGSTRHVLDALQGEQRTQLLMQLDRFGSLAAEVGTQLADAITQWAAEHVSCLQLRRGASCLVLNLDCLLRLDVALRITEVRELVEAIRLVWNPAAEAARSTAVSQIPENQVADIQYFLFERGFFAAADGLLSRRPGHYHTSEAVSVNRRAVRHLWDNAQASNKPDFGGGLTQELGYVHIAGPPQRALVLYDASSNPGTNFKDMRGTIVSAVRRMYATLESR